MVGAPAKVKNALSVKRHLFLHGDKVKIQAQIFLDLFFDVASHLQGAEKAHSFFQHNLFGPHPNRQFWGPRKNFMCLISGKGRTKGTHINIFEGILVGAKSRGPKQAVLATISCVYCFLFAAPNLEYCFQIFELNTKAAVAKAAFDTLRFRCDPKRPLTKHPQSSRVF